MQHHQPPPTNRPFFSRKAGEGYIVIVVIIVTILIATVSTLSLFLLQILPVAAWGR
jgi:hypothetical protein